MDGVTSLSLSVELVELFDFAQAPETSSRQSPLAGGTASSRRVLPPMKWRQDGTDCTLSRNAKRVATYRHPVSELHSEGEKLTLPNLAADRQTRGPRSLLPCPSAFAAVPARPFGAARRYLEDRSSEEGPGILTVSPGVGRGPHSD